MGIENRSPRFDCRTKAMIADSTNFVAVAKSPLSLIALENSAFSDGGSLMVMISGGGTHPEKQRKYRVGSFFSRNVK